jgi:hypothetical protein
MTPCNNSWLRLIVLVKGGELVSKHCVYNTSHTAIFSKMNGEETPICPYKDYSSLNRWQANGVLLPAFTIL